MKQPAPGDVSLTAAEIKKRIALLSHEYQDAAFFETTFGVTKSGYDALAKAGVKSSARGLSRFAFERFLADHKLIAPRHAAYSLGMTMASLNAIAKHTITAFHEMPQNVLITGVGFRQEFLDRLLKHFPAYAHKIFTSHSAHARAIQDAFTKAKVKIVAIRDPTAEVLGEDELVAEVDIITAGAAGLRYNVWLDFGKPFSLEPDKTSMRTYVRYESELEQFVPDHFRADKALLDRVRRALPKKGANDAV